MCVAMHDDSKDEQLGYWKALSCDARLLSVCKGQASPNNPKPDQQHCGIKGYEDFIPFRKDCYWQSSEEALTWKQAEQACIKKGAHLASVLDWTEQNFVFSRLSNQPHWIGIEGLEV